MRSLTVCPSGRARSEPHLSSVVVAQANSSVITNAAPNAPQHGHLALTGVESEMLIQVHPYSAQPKCFMHLTITSVARGMSTQGLTLLFLRAQWTTRDKGSPEVQWGLSASSLTHTAAGAGFTYNQSNLCGAPATTDGWVDPGYLQVAKMTGLKDSTRYYYKYGQVSCACRYPQRQSDRLQLITHALTAVASCPERPVN